MLAFIVAVAARVVWVEKAVSGKEVVWTIVLAALVIVFKSLLYPSGYNNISNPCRYVLALNDPILHPTATGHVFIRLLFYAASFFPRAEQALIWFNQTLYIVNILAVLAVSRLLFRDRRIGVPASVIMAFFPAFVAGSGSLFFSNYAVFIQLCLMACLFGYGKKEKLPFLLAAGCALVLLIYTRMEYRLFPFVFILLYWAKAGFGLKSTARLIWLLPLAVYVLPYFETMHCGEGSSGELYKLHLVETGIAMAAPLLLLLPVGKGEYFQRVVLFIWLLLYIIVYTVYSTDFDPLNLARYLANLAVPCSLLTGFGLSWLLSETKNGLRIAPVAVAVVLIVCNLLFSVSIKGEYLTDRLIRNMAEKRELFKRYDVLLYSFILDGEKSRFECDQESLVFAALLANPDLRLVDWNLNPEKAGVKDERLLTISSNYAHDPLPQTTLSRYYKIRKVADIPLDFQSSYPLHELFLKKRLVKDPYRAEIHEAFSIPPKEDQVWSKY